MSIHVAIATLDPLKAVEGSMGEVGYQLVDSVLPYDLRNKADLGQFASVFVSVLQETVVSILPGTAARIVLVPHQQVFWRLHCIVLTSKCFRDYTPLFLYLTSKCFT